MIKRPLVVLTCGYLLGILIGSRKNGCAFLLPLLIFLVLFHSFLFRIKSKNSSLKKLKMDWVFLLLPCFFAVGAFRVQSAEKLEFPKGYTDGDEVVFQGKITQNSSGKKQDKLVLKDDRQGKIIVYTGHGENIAPGCQVWVRGTLHEWKPADNPGQFDEKNYYMAQGICAKIYAEEMGVIECADKLHMGLWKVRKSLQQVFQRLLPEDKAGILRAMLLAENGMLDEDVKEGFRRAGLSHTLVVSGLHLSLIGYGIYRFLVCLRLGANASLLVASVVLVCYGEFVGSGIPVTRALVMLLLSLWAAPFGKTYDARTGLAVAGLCILIPMPLQLFQAGFLLSFGAIAGILLFEPLLKKIGFRRLAGNIAIQLTLLPVMLWFFYEAPTYSFFLNLLLLPFLSLLLVLAVLSGVFGLFSIELGSFFAGGVYALLQLYEWACEVNLSLKYNILCSGKPDGWKMLVYCLVLIWCIVVWKRSERQEKTRRRLLCIALLGVFVFFLPGKNEWAIDYLSVGQADCAVIRNRDITILVDGGTSVQNGGKKILEAYLKYCGDTSIEYAFISHADADHCNMLEDIFQRIAEKQTTVRVRNLVLSCAAAGDENTGKLAQKAETAGCRVLWMKKGEQLRYPGLSVSCIYPGQEPMGNAYDRNGISMVLLARTGEADFLFTGDIDAEGEKEVVEGLKKTDWRAWKGKVYLKSAHHGSKYSNSEELLSLLAQRSEQCTAVISCGRNNRYGHPHSEVLKRMKNKGIKVLRTDESGAVMVRGCESVLFIDKKGRR